MAIQQSGPSAPCWKNGTEHGNHFWTASNSIPEDSEAPTHIQLNQIMG